MPELLEDEEDVEWPAPRHTQTGMPIDQSRSSHGMYSVSAKWVRKILRSEFVDFDALLAVGQIPEFNCMHRQCDD